MKAFKSILLGAAVLALLAGNTFADTKSPVGVWKSIDDKTKSERSIIRITEVNGELNGVVEKLFDQPGDDPAHLCKECKGDRKDKPIVGMTILWGLKKDGDTWAGGEILDPHNGKIYRCKMTLSEDGKSLNVRGFIGISLIGRSQTWWREQ
ncbi:MAG TPA: DUF2147 domain-containing protein [Burkholderiales bacterium]|nr:DUF2147 domain-containing protein [Burkholderiales bacterium]